MFKGEIYADLNGIRFITMLIRKCSREPHEIAHETPSVSGDAGKLPTHNRMANEFTHRILGGLTVHVGPPRILYVLTVCVWPSSAGIFIYICAVYSHSHSRTMAVQFTHSKSWLWAFIHM